MMSRRSISGRWCADTVTVNDLTGTDVTSVLVDLAGVAGGATGNGALDQVTVHATDGDDSVVVTGSAGAGRGR